MGFRIGYKATGPLFDNHSRRLQDFVRDSIRDTAAFARGEIASETPVDTGRLKRNHDIREVTWSRTKVRNYTPYAVYQEAKVGMYRNNVRDIEGFLERQLNKIDEKFN